MVRAKRRRRFEATRQGAAIGMLVAALERKTDQWRRRSPRLGGLIGWIPSVEKGYAHRPVYVQRFFRRELSFAETAVVFNWPTFCRWPIAPHRTLCLDRDWRRVYN
jgi:hypothetical protein